MAYAEPLAEYPAQQKHRVLNAPHRPGTPSPTSPWDADVDLSVAASRRGAGAAGAWGRAATTSDIPHSPAGSICSCSNPSWETVLDAWDIAWFGCLPAPPNEQLVPPLCLATYGSLCQGNSPAYLSFGGNDADLTLLQHLSSKTTHREAAWEPVDLNLAAALASAAVARSRQHPASADQSQQTHSTLSPQGGSAGSGVLQAHSISVPCEIAAALQPSSAPTSHGHDSPVVEPGSFSDTLLQPVQAVSAHDVAGSAARPAPPQPMAVVQPAVLGTWVNRQYHLLDALQEPQGNLSRSQPGSIANSVNSRGNAQMRAVQSQEQLQGLPQAAAPAAQHQQVPQQGQVAGRPQPTLDAQMDAAWRWRFARRWHAEQQRTAEDHGPGSPDKTDEALAYLHAGGGTGWNMQVAVARTQSTEASALHSMGTQGAGSLLAGEMLLEDGSYTTAGSLARATRNDSATGQVNSLNRRAMHLLETQTQLERAAEERWNSSVMATGGDNWVGHHMATVEIDDWGTFKFLVVRVRGKNSKQRILIRGRNYCSEGQITEDINRKMMQLAAQKGCATEVLEVMGGGVMEWRRERDRHLHLHSGFSCAPSLTGPKPTSGQELLNLAAVLTKQHLPVHFKVSIQGL